MQPQPLQRQHDAGGLLAILRLAEAREEVLDALGVRLGGRLRAVGGRLRRRRGRGVLRARRRGGSEPQEGEGGAETKHAGSVGRGPHEVNSNRRAMGAAKRQP